jgi:acetyl esterase/lipase
MRIGQAFCVVAVITCVLVVALPVVAEPLEMPLWKDGAPGTEGHRDQAEQSVKDHEQEGWITNVNNPSLTVFLPDPDKVTGAAIVIAPGGGHSILAIQHEGYQVGQFLADHGIAGFVLKYRLYRQAKSPYHREDAIADGERAMRLVRSHADEWHVRPDRIGLLGFSAGGDLTFAVTQNSDAAAVDPIDRVSSRPDFQVPIYPGGLDRNPPEFSDKTPPTLLICAVDDNIAAKVPDAFLALRKAKVPVELHIYGSGGHGFGMHPGESAVNHWPDRLYDWMHDRELLAK